MTTAPGPRLTFANTVAAEWMKLATLRSTFVIALLAIVVSVGFSLLIALSFAATPEPAAADGPARYASTIAGSVSFAQLVVAIFAVLAVSSEYGTRMIQVTLAAVPRRLPVFAAKAIVIVMATVAVSIVSSLLSFGACAVVLGGVGLHAPLTDSHVLGAIAYAALYQATVAVFSTAVAMLVRRSAGAIAIVVGMYFVLPIAFSAVGFDDLRPSEYLLSYTGDTMLRGLYNAQMATDTLRNGLITAAWLIVPAGVAAVLLKRRDA